MRTHSWQPNYALQQLNTFGLPSTAEYFSRPSSWDEALQDVKLAAEQGLTLNILGGGSNVVLLPQLAGLCVQPGIDGIDRVASDAKSVVLSVGAATHWHGFVRFCVANALSGIENLSLIPGTVGAAPIQNIGAYGAEVSQLVCAVEALDVKELTAVTFSRDECEFNYRSSLFKREKGRYLILRVQFRLNRQFVPNVDYPDIRAELSAMGLSEPELRHPVQVAEAVIRVRRRKLPDVRDWGNAGSFFKNPLVSQSHFAVLSRAIPGLAGFADKDQIKISAAKLIEAAGWKGRISGGAAVWRKQPLVLVNQAAAKAADVLALAADIQADIDRRYGVMLEPEVQVLGSDA